MSEQIKNIDFVLKRSDLKSMLMSPFRLARPWTTEAVLKNGNLGDFILLAFYKLTPNQVVPPPSHRSFHFLNYNLFWLLSLG